MDDHEQVGQYERQGAKRQKKLISRHLGVLVAGMASHFINARFIAKCADLIRSQWRAGLPIDLYLRQQAYAGGVEVYPAQPPPRSPSRSPTK